MSCRDAMQLNAMGEMIFINYYIKLTIGCAFIKIFSFDAFVMIAIIYFIAVEFWINEYKKLFLIKQYIYVVELYETTKLGAIYRITWFSMFLFASLTIKL